MQSLFQQFEGGKLVAAGRSVDVQELAWNPHPSFKGVSLKNVVTAEHTAGLLTCHLVRIAPECAIGMHTHPTSMEVHEVVQGSGVCLTEDGEIPYVPGTIAVLPHNAPHEVRAGGQGLCLFAKFVAVTV